MKADSRYAAHIALVHMESAQDHYQAVQALSLPENIKRNLLTAMKVSVSIAEDIRKWGKIKPEQPAVFLPAFPKATQYHIKPRVSYRHYVQR